MKQSILQIKIYYRESNYTHQTLFTEPNVCRLVVSMLASYLCRTKRTELTVLGRKLNVGWWRKMTG